MNTLVDVYVLILIVLVAAIPMLALANVAVWLWNRLDAQLDDDYLEGDGDEPTCTGITAGWCPVCGFCTCVADYAEDHEVTIEQADEWRMSGDFDLDSTRCPLHAPDSLHGELSDA